MIITGHRGALGTEPENTLRSFRRAAADGCDEIELDLRVSADGELVVMHDPTVDRTTSGSGEVAALTLAELRALDAGRGERIPTWAEVVAAVDVRIQAELKAEAAVPLLAQSLRSDPALAARTLVTSFQPDLLLAIRDLFPEAETGHIFGHTPSAAELITRTRSAGATWSLCTISGLTPETVAALHTAGLQVAAWPVPNPQTLTQAQSLPADAITTDNPHLLHTP
ncbi:glycerophosphodiester phosphodiesterase [Kribbella sp.]|uniref:glycerophosphodiester phosphodiesterase n=1 Tax=Kribbella sp. TaxID=1871183 RepID=UPI002D21F335|nr:glycerophosphodiester phosphodiesterase family protein [Kribbella sp.]HZX01425.1 glycerophosphodiester phosphodiesterase family protein [Kribbella sp.]